MSFPTRLEDITPEWLSDVFGSKVSFTLETLGEGPGYVSDMTRLNLSSDDSSVPRKAIVKVNPSFEGANEIARRYALFEREALFYKEAAAATPIRTPHVYFADADVANSRGIILMEDCSHLETRPSVSDTPPTPEEIRSVMNSAARLHAHWWNRDPAECPWAMTPDDALFQTFMLDCAEGWPAFTNSELMALLPSDAQALAERLPEEFGPKMLKAMPRDRLTLCHLDFHIDNMFFEPGADDPIVLFDWAGASWGRGTNDIAYFLGFVLDPETRRANEIEALNHYHETLVANGVTDYSRDELTTDYKLGTLFALWVVPIAVANLDMSSDYAQKLISNVVTNKFSAALDHGATEILDSL